MRVNHQHETNNLASNSGLFGCALSAQNCAPISPKKNAKLQEKINQLLESTEKPLMDNIHDTLSGLRRLDIDKRWDFLHFGLTGTSAFDPAKNDPLSRAVLGEHSLEDGIDGFLGLTWNQELAATIDRLESLDRSELRKQFSIKRLNEMEIYPGVTFSEELEGQLFASIMLDMEKLISAYRRMLRQGNHALTVIVG